MATPEQLDVYKQRLTAVTQHYVNSVEALKAELDANSAHNGSEDSANKTTTNLPTYFDITTYTLAAPKETKSKICATTHATEPNQRNRRQQPTRLEAVLKRQPNTTLGNCTTYLTKRQPTLTNSWSSHG